MSKQGAKSWRRWKKAVWVVWALLIVNAVGTVLDWWERMAFLLDHITGEGKPLATMLSGFAATVRWPWWGVVFVTIAACVSVLAVVRLSRKIEQRQKEIDELQEEIAGLRREIEELQEERRREIEALQKKLEELEKLKPPQPLPLTSEEKEQVQHYRTLWNLHGAQPVESLYHCFKLTIATLNADLWWGELLQWKFDELARTKAEFAEAVAMEGAPQLGPMETRRRFISMWEAYRRVAWWMWQLERRGEIREKHVPGMLQAWHGANSEFQAKAIEMAQRPEHVGLPVGTPKFGDPQLREFLVWTGEVPPLPEAKPTSGAAD